MLRFRDSVAGEHLASGRFDGAAHDARVSPSQSPRDANERATRAHAGRPTVDTSADGVQQLSGSAGLVRCFAFWGIELVDVEAAPLSGESFCDARRGCNIGSSDLPWLARDLRHKDYLGAERCEHTSALWAVSSRHSDNQRMHSRQHEQFYSSLSDR
jgi:hypothetical protein